MRLGVGDEFTSLNIQAATKKAAAAVTDSAWISLKGYKGRIKFVFSTEGSAGNVDNTLNVKLRGSEAADGSNPADIALGAFPQNAAAAGPAAVPQLSELHFNAEELPPYVSARMTVVGTTPSYPLSVVGVGFKQPST
jgi:hypothetical protein